MNGGRTENWWVTRFELGVAILAILAIVAVIQLTPSPFIDPYPTIGVPFGHRVPAGVVCDALAVTSALVGLGLMVRIFRRKGDEPPPWRYRDR